MSSRSGEVARLSQGDLKIRIEDGKAVKPAASQPVERGLVATLALWWHRHADRRQFARDMKNFPDAVMRDFGLTREQAEAEVRRPFWRA